MRTCPHCQFLVAEGATSCSVCHRDLAAAPITPVPVAAGAQSAPGFVTAPPPYHGTAPAAQVPGAMLPDAMAAARPRRRNGWLIAILATCVIGATGVVAFAALFLLGVTVPGPPTDSQSELVVDELAWELHRDPEGRFSAEMPGETTSTRSEVPDGAGDTTATEVVQVGDARFNSLVHRYEEPLPFGATFTEPALDPAAAEQAVASSGLEQARLVSQDVLDGDSGSRVDAVFAGTLDGEPALLVSRLSIHDGVLYELVTIGPESRREELLAIQARMVASFSAPI
jgi:hypothetical protein